MSNIGNSSLQTEIDLALSACELSNNDNAVRSILGSLFDQNLSKNHDLSKYLITELFVGYFSQRFNQNRNDDKNTGVIHSLHGSSTRINAIPAQQQRNSAAMMMQPDDYARMKRSIRGSNRRNNNKAGVWVGVMGNDGDERMDVDGGDELASDGEDSAYSRNSSMQDDAVEYYDNIKPLPVTSPSQITINKHSSLSHASRQIWIPSRKELRLGNDGSDDLYDDDSGSDIPSSSSEDENSMIAMNADDDSDAQQPTYMDGPEKEQRDYAKNQGKQTGAPFREDKDELYYDELPSSNEQDYDDTAKATSSTKEKAEEDAWKQALLHQAMDMYGGVGEEEGEDDEGDERNVTHLDLFKQLRRNIKLQQREQGKALRLMQQQIVPGTAHMQNSSSAAGNKESSLMSGTPPAASSPVDEIYKNENISAALEEEEEDYEAPMYTTPPQAAPPPPLPLFAVSSGSNSSFGKSRRTKTSRMRKRSNNSTATSGGIVSAGSNTGSKKLSPSKRGSGSSILVTTGATITTVSPSSASKPSSMERVDGVDNGGFFKESVSTGKGKVTEQDLSSNNSIAKRHGHNIEITLAPVAAESSCPGGGSALGSNGKEIVLSDDDAENNSGSFVGVLNSKINDHQYSQGDGNGANIAAVSEPKLPLSTRVELAIQNVLNAHASVNSIGSSDLSVMVFTKEILIDISDSIIEQLFNITSSSPGFFGTDEEYEQRETKSAIGTILAMFVGSCLLDRDNVALMVQIITQSILSADRRQAIRVGRKNSNFRNSSSYDEEDDEDEGDLDEGEYDSSSVARSSSDSAAESNYGDPRFRETYCSYEKRVTEVIASTSNNNIQAVDIETKSVDEDITHIVIKGLKVRSADGDPQGVTSSGFQKTAEERNTSQSAEDILKENGLLDAVNALPSNFSSSNKTERRGDKNKGSNNIRNAAPGGNIVGESEYSKEKGLDASELMSDNSSDSTEDNTSGVYQRYEGCDNHYGDVVQTYPIVYDADDVFGKREQDEVVSDREEDSGSDIDSNSTESTVQKSIPFNYSDELYQDYNLHNVSNEEVEAMNSATTPRKLNSAARNLSQDEEVEVNNPNAAWNAPVSPYKAFRTSVGGMGRTPLMQHLKLDIEDCDDNDDVEDREITEEFYREEEEGDIDVLNSTCTINVKSMTLTTKRSEHKKLATIAEEQRLKQSPLSTAMREQLRPEALHAILSSPTATYMGYQPSSNSDPGSPAGFENDGEELTSKQGSIPDGIAKLSTSGDYLSDKNCSSKGSRGSASEEEQQNADDEDIITIDDLSSSEYSTFNTQIQTHTSDYSFNPKKGWFTVDKDEDTVADDEEDEQRNVDEESSMNDSSINSYGNFIGEDLSGSKRDMNVDSNGVRGRAQSQRNEGSLSSYGHDGNSGAVEEMYDFTQNTIISQRWSYSEVESAMSFTSTPATCSMMHSPTEGANTILVKDEKGRVARLPSPSNSLNASFELNPESSGKAGTNQSINMSQSTGEETAAAAAYKMLQRALSINKSLSEAASTQDGRNIADAEEEFGANHEGGEIQENDTPIDHPMEIEKENVSVIKARTSNEQLNVVVEESLRQVQDQYRGLNGTGDGVDINYNYATSLDNTANCKPIRYSSISSAGSKNNKKQSASGTTLLTLSPAKLAYDGGIGTAGRIDHDDADGLVHEENEYRYNSVTDQHGGSGNLIHEFDDSDLSSSPLGSSDEEGEAEENDGRYKGDDILHSLGNSGKRRIKNNGSKKYATWGSSKQQAAHVHTDSTSDESDDGEEDMERLFSYEYNDFDDDVGVDQLQYEDQQILSAANAGLISNMRQMYGNASGLGSTQIDNVDEIDDSDSDEEDEEPEEEDARIDYKEEDDEDNEHGNDA